MDIIQKANKENKRPSAKTYNYNGPGKGVMHQKELSNNEIDAIVLEYNEGSTIKDICLKYNIGPHIISKLLKDHDIEIRNNNQLDEDVIYSIINMYLEGNSTIKI
jgi:hypothetical protein